MGENLIVIPAYLIIPAYLVIPAQAGIQPVDSALAACRTLWRISVRKRDWLANVRLKFVLAIAVFLAMAGHSVTRAVQIEFVPRNPAPGDLIQVLVKESPPGCPAELRIAGPTSRNVYFFVFVIDTETPPAARSCDWVGQLGSLAQDRYTISFTNTLTNELQTYSFDVAPGGAGGLVSYPIPAVNGGGLIAMIFLISVAALVAIRRRPVLNHARTAWKIDERKG